MRGSSARSVPQEPGPGAVPCSDPHLVMGLSLFCAMSKGAQSVLSAPCGRRNRK